MKVLVIFTILSLQLCSILTICTQPQIIYRNNKNSIFVSKQDIEFGFLEGFYEGYRSINLNTGKFLNKNTYTLSEIVPVINYYSEKQINTLGTNTINEAGELEIYLQMNFFYTNSHKKSSGTALAKFPSTFFINLTKTVNFNPNNAKTPLQWTCTLNQLNLSNLTFIRQSGSDLDLDTINIFNELLQNTNKEQYFSAVLQIQDHLNKTVKMIAAINNDHVKQLFSEDYQYYGDRLERMNINVSLVGYSLDSTGETLQIIGIPEGQDICLNIQTFNQPVNYIAVSTSFINNTYDFLLGRKFLDVKMNSQEWNIPNFYFQIRDLVFVLPKITNYYQIDDKFGGPCTYDSGSAPVVIKLKNQKIINFYILSSLSNLLQTKILQFNETDKSFVMNGVYSCSIRSLTSDELIMTFTVNSQLILSPQYGQIQVYSVNMIIQDAHFIGSNFLPVDYLAPLQNMGILQYFLDNAAGSIIGMSVFGSGLFNLPYVQTNPQWEMANDQTTMYFYGSSHSDDNKIKIE